MSNMTTNQRSQYERADLAAGGQAFRRGSERGAMIFNAIAGLIGIGLSIVAVASIEGWAQWVVLAVIVLTTVGFMIAINPNRRG